MCRRTTADDRPEAQRTPRLRWSSTRTSTRRSLSRRTRSSIVLRAFGRIIDISSLAYPQIISNFRLPHIDDNYDFATGKFVCADGQQSIHQPWFDYRSPSLFYQAWYDQGVRAWDISNPFLPREVGYFLSPRYEPPGVVGRQTRETYQDPDTGLIYASDGNGGGLTVLRWTGPIPAHPPIPGAR